MLRERSADSAHEIIRGIYMAKKNILVLCTGNSARSQMAEAYLRKASGDRFDVFSAGLDPKEVHPMTIQVMEEDGIDMSGHRSKPVKEYLGKMAFQYVITVCSNAEKNCPTVFPFAINRLHWPFEDPAAQGGSDEEKAHKFRKVRDQIKEKVSKWLEITN